MEEENHGFSETHHRYRHEMNMISPEIVEISEESTSIRNSRDGGIHDVYVAVHRDDLDVLKWALDHAVLPGTRVFLIHVYSPITYIPTPGLYVSGGVAVGRLSKTQLSKDQLKAYIREENTRRINLLQKYIRMCNDAKVPVETMLIESEVPAKAILELITVLNINTLVMGIKRSSSRMLRKGMGKSKSVHKNAPDFCEVILVSNGKKVVDEQKVGPELTSPASNDQRPVILVSNGKKVVDEQKVGPEPTSPASNDRRRPEMRRNGERNFFECGCFSGKFK